MEDNNVKLPENLTRAGFVLTAGMLLRTGGGTELEEALLRAYSTEKQVELVDDSAIKADYDTAAAILERLEIPYEAR